MVKKHYQISSSLKTTFNLGSIYDNSLEGSHQAEITEAGFVKETYPIKNTGEEKEYDILKLTLEFESVPGLRTVLHYKVVVSRKADSPFVQLLKEFSLLNAEGKVDVSNLAREKVVAEIKKNTDSQGRTFSNVIGIKKAS